MKYLIVALTFVASVAHSEARAAEVMPGPYQVSSYSVYDGDTFKAHVRIWLGQTIDMSIRIDGIDTPEIRTKCLSEKAQGLVAKATLETLFKGQKIELHNIRYGKYAARVLATVTVNGENVADVLIQQGVARPYQGGKREGWCDSGPGTNFEFYTD